VKLPVLPVFALIFAAYGCAVPSEEGQGEPQEEQDLPLGDREGLDDLKADGWGSALECKPIPNLPPLADPAITISIDGLTLHLVDRAGDYDRVFPVGVGQIDLGSGLTSGESHTMWPVLDAHTQEFRIKTTDSYNFNACRVWWTDSETNETLPVFAGLPFMRWSGSYGIHGPITNYQLPNGGNLKRGYVSHGCVRMEAADVVEVYARIRGVSSVPVRVQREAERTVDHQRVDVETRWIGAECTSNADCNFEGGFCKQNPLGGTGFCTRSCTQYCPDRSFAPKTFCVADPDDATKGICTIKQNADNYGCRPYEHLTPRTAKRFNQTSVTANVCLPGSRGWIGDRCASESDCQEPNQCVRGICTQSCTSACPDQEATPSTFCAQESSFGAPTCLRQCTPVSNGSECPADSQCVPRKRAGSTTVTRNVCVPE